MHTSPLDGIEEALIHLQYAVADYQNRSEADRAADSGALDAPLRELRLRATSIQIAIHLMRTVPQDDRRLAS
jgi:hypothetical protein